MFYYYDIMKGLYHVTCGNLINHLILHFAFYSSIDLYHYLADAWHNFATKGYVEISYRGGV